MKGRWLVALILSLSFGVSCGALFLWLGLVHNHQSEFRLSSGSLDCLYCAKQFVSWLVVGTGLGIIMLVAAVLLRRLLRAIFS
jgi:hypothetical protein